ncbi:MAG: hypothetical protein FWB74_07300 [Defluviitaleaceae bacterium]|nr:hypothetical protein [Defluviitaleaceae bacterium]
MGERTFRGYFENGEFHFLEKVELPAGRNKATLTIEPPDARMPHDEWVALMRRLLDEAEDEILPDDILGERPQAPSPRA